MVGVQSAFFVKPGDQTFKYKDSSCYKILYNIAFLERCGNVKPHSIKREIPYLSIDVVRFFMKGIIRFVNTPIDFHKLALKIELRCNFWLGIGAAICYMDLIDEESF